MDSTYFAECGDLGEARKLFHKLAHELHPDKGGDVAAFRALVDDFQRCQQRAWDRSGQAKWGAEYKSKRSFDLTDLTVEKLRAALRFHDVTTEIMGTWIWCTGDTRAYASEFKGLSFRWCPKKRAWNYHDPGEGYRKRTRRFFSLDEIRGLHGSRSVEQEPDVAVAGRAS